MSYSSGMLNKRIRIARRSDEQHTQFGEDGKPNYEWLGWFWANETWNKGARVLQQGAIEDYDTVMFRLRFNPNIDRWCIIWCEDTFYQITSFHADRQANTIQLIAVEMANSEGIRIIEPSES